MKLLTLLCGFVLLFTTQVFCAAGAGAQSPNLVGRWVVEFALSDQRTHKLQLDVDESGRVTYLLLDIRSNLLPPAEPTKAELTQIDATQFSLEGSIEFPIGNVGRDAGTLVLKGTITSTDLIVGEAAFFRLDQNPKDARSVPAKTGSFTARRTGGPSGSGVQLLSLNSGTRLRRGQEVEIEWSADSTAQLSSQQVFISLDNGASFIPITESMDGNTRRITWAVPKSLPKAKKALVKIIVTYSNGRVAEDTSDHTFKIK